MKRQRNSIQCKRTYTNDDEQLNGEKSNECENEACTQVNKLTIYFSVHTERKQYCSINATFKEGKIRVDCMSYEVVLGRNEKDRKRLGTKGCVLVGKHYVKMGETSSLSNEIYMDVSRSHVVFLCGKRGSGKSFSLAVIAEGMAALQKEVRKNIGVLIMDTMGIYWSMKYPNERMRELLEQWGMSPQGLDIQLYAPYGKVTDMQNEGIPVDEGFSIRPADISPSHWPALFELDPSSGTGALLESTADVLSKKGSFSIDEFIEAIENSGADKDTIRAAKNLLGSAQRWGLFYKQATPIHKMVEPGKITVLDISPYAATSSAWNVRALVIGIVGEQLFEYRMRARKAEEYKALKQALSYQSDSGNTEPVIWMLIDEAHEFLPREGKTPATDALVTILREGRQPGLSLILATQQPGKIHTDVMTQSDIIISHRITAKADTDALGMLTQSYMRAGLDVLLNELPRMKGAAVVLDDNNEKLYSMQVRPRISWHGGDDPDALRGVDE